MANAEAEQATIQEVMEEKNIDPGGIPSERHIRDPSNPGSISGSKRYFRTKAFARFPRHRVKVPGCARTWPSAHAWSVMDLKKQRICHRYSQECQSCEGAGEPVYDEDAIRRMAEWACDEYLVRVGRRVREQRFGMGFLLDALGVLAMDESSQPHDRQRCDMCRRLGRECWK